MTDFDAFFRQSTAHGDNPGNFPHPWQRALAFSPACRSQLVRIPTGYGKTLGVAAAWTYNRVHRQDDRWPRRLVWTLPMRVLAEQTAAELELFLSRLGLLATPGARAGKVAVHVAMGGIDAGDWSLHPEEPAILVGTQDMLLSRALNRGYAAPRARWPMEFGLLSHDCLWVLDEVQLMDVGLATSAQLQSFRDADASRGFRPCATWWMSATLQPDWLHSVDTAPHHPTWTAEPTTLDAPQRAHGLAAIPKALERRELALADDVAFASLVWATHQENPGGPHGRITLVVCNTVKRACELHALLAKRHARGTTTELRLVHSRFRPHERQAWRQEFLSRAACTPDADRIIVATQVVEAGVDISAMRLVTELAPWSSLVQRFGRCARYAPPAHAPASPTGGARTLVVHRGTDDKAARPYAPDELDAAWDALLRLDDAGIAALEAFEEALSPAGRATLYPYEPAHLLLRRDYDELFDTTPDLSGADIDVSRYIRSGTERDVHVFWHHLEPTGRFPAPPPPTRRPHRAELCAVPFLEARDWLCGTGDKPRLRDGVHAWVWDWLEGQWVRAERAALLPGRTVCVSAACGGYDPQRGFDASSSAAVAPVPAPAADVPATATADDQEDSEALSETAYKTIACHGSEAAQTATAIAAALRLPAAHAQLLATAALWHDLGKAHPAFQGAIAHTSRPHRPDLAKAPKDAWLRPLGTYPVSSSESRPGFRHELASMLALFAVLEAHDPTHPALLGPWAELGAALGWSPPAPTAASPPTPLERAILGCTAEQFDLLAYLVLCHHGKVRLALHVGPKDQTYADRDGRGLPMRGVRERDRLPSTTLDPAAPPLPELTLTLEPATLGLSPRTGRSWRDRCLGLQATYGPAALAWLEALLMAADRRASKLTTSDPALTQEVRA